MKCSEHLQSNDYQLSKRIFLEFASNQLWRLFGRRLNLPELLKVCWVLRSAIVDRVPKHLCVWLSKIFLNFAGTAHQLYRQTLCNSPICRCCLIELKLDTLHFPEYKQELFMGFKMRLVTQLKQDVLGLTKEDLTTF